ncbi:hypothetical protein SAMN05192544_102590 [Paraburkholderia hospita]|nr:hypothetical protein SAMN05192544_102590 [Paraburkholderia hospita]
MFSDNQTRDKVITKMREVWGEECSIQIYGSGGRIVGEKTEVRFASLAELESIIKNPPILSAVR